MPDATGLSEVQRYQPVRAMYTCVEGGDYVKYADYAALAERLQKAEAYGEVLLSDCVSLAKRNARLTAALEELTTACKALPANDGRLLGLLPIITRCEAALTEPPDGKRGGYDAESQH